MKAGLFVIVIIALLSSCEKKPSCGTSMVLSSTSLTPTVGDDVTITAPFYSSNDVYQWNGPGVNLITQSPTLNLGNIKLSQSGVYSCGIGGSGDCNPLSDTIRISVKMKQETPPCTVTNNTAVFSSIPNYTFSSVTQGFDGTYNAVSLYGYVGFSYLSITVLFNSYNGNTEPLDGTHVTTENPAFQILQEPNEVSLSFIHYSNYYHSKPGYKVYVSHVNGKLQVSFCDVVFYSSSLAPITCSAKMTEL